ncbi:MAG: DUF4115 domain-containing protein [Bacteroidia bacterium]|nr:DUF4115 domain-containing protein [Methylotenera sp.]
MADEISIEPPMNTALNYAPLGEALLSARNTKKLTQKDVSNSLRISIKQIAALETNDFTILPDAMITRGFIRNYARFLDIDAEPLLASYRARMPDKTPNAISVQPSMNQIMSGKESQPWLMYILGSILVLLFLLAWLFYVDYMPKPVKPVVEKISEIAAVSTPPAEIALPEIALPVAEREAENEATASDVVSSEGKNNQSVSSSALPTQSSVLGTTATVSPTPTTANPSTGNLATASPATVTSVTVPASTVTNSQGKSSTPAAVDFNTLKANAARALQPTAVTLPDTKIEVKTQTVMEKDLAAKNIVAKNAATKKVTMAVGEQTWVRVSDKSGAIVFEKMLAANSVESFDGIPPLNMLIGNAKATNLTFLGKSVDLTNYTKNNVARIVLE